MAAEEENQYWDCCVYKITVGDDFYIGSTKNLSKRRQAHQDNIKNDKPYDLYKAIRSHGSWEIKRLYNIDVSSKKEQLEEERKAVDELKPTLNMYRPTITNEERLQHAREKRRIYRELFPERVSAQNKAWREGPNREANLAKKREYNKTHPENRPVIIITCECGKEINKRRLAAHCNTKAHIKIMEGV